jgi:hypothetical protein
LFCWRFALRLFAFSREFPVPTELVNSVILIFHCCRIPVPFNVTPHLKHMTTVMSGLFVALWVGRALGAACGTASPMALPITDTAVDPNIPDSLMRGIPARIGTPPQNIVVLPWP